MVSSHSVRSSTVSSVTLARSRVRVRAGLGLGLGYEFVSCRRHGDLKAASRRIAGFLKLWCAVCAGARARVSVGLSACSGSIFYAIPVCNRSMFYAIPDSNQ